MFYLISYREIILCILFGQKSNDARFIPSELLQIKNKCQTLLPNSTKYCEGHLVSTCIIVSKNVFQQSTCNKKILRTTHMPDIKYDIIHPQNSQNFHKIPKFLKIYNTVLWVYFFVSISKGFFFIRSVYSITSHDRTI